MQPFEAVVRGEEVQGQSLQLAAVVKYWQELQLAQRAQQTSRQSRSPDLPNVQVLQTPQTGECLGAEFADVGDIQGKVAKSGHGDERAVQGDQRIGVQAERPQSPQPAERIPAQLRYGIMGYIQPLQLGGVAEVGGSDAGDPVVGQVESLEDVESSKQFPRKFRQQVIHQVQLLQGVEPPESLGVYAM